MEPEASNQDGPSMSTCPDSAAMALTWRMCVQVFEVIAEILSYYDYRSKHTSEQTEECLQKLRSHTSQFITRSPPSK